MSNKIDSEGHQHIETERARGAESPRVVRYILAAGLTLVIVSFAIILLI
jgi:hypothetical protein